MSLNSGLVTDVLTWTANGSPANATGFTLSGVPSGAGSYPFSVRVSDRFAGEPVT